MDNGESMQNTMHTSALRDTKVTMQKGPKCTKILHYEQMPQAS